MENSRRSQAKMDLHLINNRELQSIKSAKTKELERQTKKRRKKQELEESFSYKSAQLISKILDEWYLDGIIGFIPVIGDMANAIFVVPFIYISLVKIRSIPLTLACIFNVLVDCFLGMIPFWIGDILDFFNRAYRKNLRLIIGFVEDDKEIINEVNRKAIIMAVFTVIVCLLIYWLISLVGSMLSKFIDWIGSLF